MTDQTTKPHVLILSTSAHGSDSELSFVTRAVAGAASRAAQVTVYTPMPSGTMVADGAFELRGIGHGRGDGWPSPDQAMWNPQPDPKSTWLLDLPSKSAVALSEAWNAGSRVYSVKPVEDAFPSVTPLPFVPRHTQAPCETLGVYVPVNPLAATHRHAGLGFTGYLLVLTDRQSKPTENPPTPAVAWLTSRFHDQYVVVVEGGRAVVWKGRALRGSVGVDTRMDLWRLMAHANVTVDLAPGEIIARECVESLRFGTPIIVPSDTPGAGHARAGGGFTFTDVTELLEGIELVLHGPDRDRCSHQGFDYANSRYGDPAASVAGLARELGLSASPSDS